MEAAATLEVVALDRPQSGDWGGGGMLAERLQCSVVPRVYISDLL